MRRLQSVTTSLIPVLKVSPATPHVASSGTPPIDPGLGLVPVASYARDREVDQC
jgi:hypothetical protein